MARGAGLRRAADAGMTLCLFLLMGFPFFGMTAHMAGGIGFFACMFLHHWLNRQWTFSLLRGKWNAVRIWQTGINLLLAADMAALLWSSLILVGAVWPGFPRMGSFALGREIHMAAAYWGFVLMSAHIGLHGEMIAGAGRRWSAAGKRAFSTAFLAAAAYGAWALYERQWLSYLFLQTEFVFFDFQESRFLFYLDHEAIMALFIWIGYQGLKAARRIQRRKR